MKETVIFSKDAHPCFAIPGSETFLVKDTGIVGSIQYMPGMDGKSVENIKKKNSEGGMGRNRRR